MAKAHGKTLQYVLEEQSDRAWCVRRSSTDDSRDRLHSDHRGPLGYGKESVFYSKGDGKPLVALNKQMKKDKIVFIFGQDHS